MEEIKEPRPHGGWEGARHGNFELFDYVTRCKLEREKTGVFEFHLHPRRLSGPQGHVAAGFPFDGDDKMIAGNWVAIIQAASRKRFAVLVQKGNPNASAIANVGVQDQGVAVGYRSVVVRRDKLRADDFRSSRREASLNRSVDSAMSRASV